MLIRIPQEASTQRSVAMTLGIMASAALVLRIVIVMLWSVMGGHALSENLWVEIALTAASNIVLAGIVGLTVLFYARRMAEELRYETMAGALTTYAVSSLALLLLGAIVPFRVEDGTPQDLLSTFTSHVVALGTFTITIGLAGFLVQVLMARRQRSTQRLLVTLLILVLLIWLGDAMSGVWGGFSFIALVLVMVGAIVMLMTIRRLNWLATISMDKKIRLLWLTLCGGFAAFVLTIQHAFFDEAAVTISADMFIRSGAILPAAVNFFGLVFFGRLLFAVIAALPNSGIVDRRSSEVESLTYLTRLMAESASVDDLLTSVTQFALRVCRGHGAWCETYVDGELRVAAAQLVHADYVHALHGHRQLHRLLVDSERPVLVDSIAERFPEIGSTLAVRSMIVVPLLSEHRRIGTLVMFSTVDYGFEADDLRLLTAFGDTISIALDQARLTEAAMERERMQREFDVARRIQSSLLPRTAPLVPCFDVDAVMIPATEVGGDYYDYIRFRSGRPGVIIADVSGKGIPAALYMATLKGVVLAEMRSSDGPADLLRRVNATLHGSMERSTYITMACVEFDPECRSLRLARAGHTPAIVRTGGDVRVLTPRGMAIGIVGPAMFDAAISEEVVDVVAGDICLLTTDGVTERRNRERTEIEIDTVTDLVAGVEQLKADDLVRATLDMLELHADGAEPHDDITIVAIVINDKTETDGREDRMNVSYGVTT